MNNLVARAIEFLTPFPCLVCGGEGELLCSDCLEVVVIPKPETCPLCNVLSPAGRTCRRCLESCALTGATVIAHYDGMIKQLVLRTKFHSYRSGARLIAGLIAPNLDPADFDVIAAVPTTAPRRRQRGYNQAELIARELGRSLGLPCAPLLGRTGRVRQMGASRTERLQQLAGSFYALRSCQGQRVLLVDDVLTTGATLSECAATLTAAGATCVWGAALAKH